MCDRRTHLKEARKGQYLVIVDGEANKACALRAECLCTSRMTRVTVGLEKSNREWVAGKWQE